MADKVIDFPENPGVSSIKLELGKVRKIVREGSFGGGNIHSAVLSYALTNTSNEIMDGFSIEVGYYTSDNELLAVFLGYGHKDVNPGEKAFFTDEISMSIADVSLIDRFEYRLSGISWKAQE